MAQKKLLDEAMTSEELVAHITSHVFLWHKFWKSQPLPMVRKTGFKKSHKNIRTINLLQKTRNCVLVSKRAQLCQWNNKFICHSRLHLNNDFFRVLTVRSMQDSYRAAETLKAQINKHINEWYLLTYIVVVL